MAWDSEAQRLASEARVAAIEAELEPKDSPPTVVLEAFTQSPGQSNCASYTSANQAMFGSVVGLHENWQFVVPGLAALPGAVDESRGMPSDPWVGSTPDCSTNQPVWCVEN